MFTKVEHTKDNTTTTSYWGLSEDEVAPYLSEETGWTHKVSTVKELPWLKDANV